MSMEQLLNDLNRSVGRIEGKIDGLNDQMADFHIRAQGLEQSVTTLKVSTGVITTKMAVFGSMAGAVGAWLINFLSATLK